MQSLVLLKLSILKVLSEDFQDHLNNNNMKNRQEKLSRIQFLKINHIVKNYKQDSKSNNNNSALQYDRKA